MALKSEKIAIVGAGVFGLSSALHLLDAGYRDIELFDRQPYDCNHYDSLKPGADAASCDLNKILRASYAADQASQRLALDATAVWKKWNALQPDHEPLFDECGYLRMDDHEEHHEDELANLENYTQSGLRHTQFDMSSQEDIRRAAENGVDHKLDPLQRRSRGLHTIGVLDMSAGMLHASRACTFVLGMLQKRGVRLFLGGDKGTFQSWMEDSTGFYTMDGVPHTADRIVLATGAWTPGLCPILTDKIEATAGTVALLQIPVDRQDLLLKYSSPRMPIVHWKAGHALEKEVGGGIYAFPSTSDGMIKIGLRQIKWTNPAPNKTSTPLTDSTVPSETRIPLTALEHIKNFIQINMPDLVQAGAMITKTRLCWYTDTFDNQFFICPMPLNPKIVLCTGGSGHGFKFLPVLGRVVVDVMAGRTTELTHKYRWRTQREVVESDGVDGHSFNIIGEDPSTVRELRQQTLAGNDHFSFPGTLQ